MRKGKQARTDITESQTAHSILKLRYELNRLAAQPDQKIAAHAARLLRWAAAHQQRRITRTIAHHDARVGTPSAPAHDDEDDDDRDDNVDDNDCEDDREDDEASNHDYADIPTDRRQQRQQQPQTEQLWLLPRAGAEAHARWALARASGALHKNTCGTGRAAGTSAALRIWNSISVVCQRAGCHALVDLKAARRQTRARGSAAFLPGDGCAGPLCSADYRSTRFGKRQLQQAEQIDNGRRLLARWPTDCLDTQIYILNKDFASARAAEARQAVERPTA